MGLIYLYTLRLLIGAEKYEIKVSLYWKTENESSKK
jgi:hypothetical protein